MKINEVIKSLSSSNAAIKNTASSVSKDGWYPAYSASGQDVWLPDYRFDGKGIVVSAVGARCGKAFKADGKWNVCANTHPLIVDESKALRDYCWYMINNENWWIKGGTAQPFVKVKDSFDREYNFPPLPKQKQIVDELDLIQGLINQKKLQIKKLDNLVKARFVEMFSDEKCELLQDLSEKVTDGSHMPPKGVNKSEYMMLSSQNIFNELNFEGVRYLSKEDFENENKRTNIQNGDVLITIVGTIGRTHVVKKNEKFVFQRSVGVINPVREKLNGVYLSAFLQTNKARSFLDSGAHGSSQKGIYLQDLKKLPVPVAPIDKQNQFADFVAQVDKSKFANPPNQTLPNKLPMRNLHICLVHNRIMHSSINL